MSTLDYSEFLNMFDEVITKQNQNITDDESNWEAQEGTTKTGDEIDFLNKEKEQQLARRLNERNLLFLKKVQVAREKILDGTYGYCEDCGDEISQKRLVARPTASFCISCQEAKENFEKHTIKHRRDLNPKRKSIVEESDEHIVKRDHFNSIKDVGFESVIDA